MGKAVNIVADILQNSKLEAGAVERERDVILREQEEVEKLPEDCLLYTSPSPRDS